MAEGSTATARAVRVVETLTARGQTLASCESLTGGLLGASITDVPGASAVYRGGLITYATDLKGSLAGVDPAVLATHGAVAAATAEAMARGARQVCGADWAVATTGVAGPSPQEGHPAGTVFVAVLGPDVCQVRRLALSGDRWAIRARSVAEALDRLLTALG